MSIAKVIEVVVQSEQSFDDAIRQGLSEAIRTLRGISGIDIVNWTANVANDQIVGYKVTMHIAFQVEHESSRSQTGAHRQQPARTTGSGDLRPGDEAPPGTPGTGENICPTCSGSGSVNGQVCSTCHGTGYVVEGIGGA